MGILTSPQYMNLFRSVKTLKPIFHCDSKPLALGPGIGLNPNATVLRHLTQNIPTCWYFSALPNAKICVSPDGKLKICVSPDANPRRHAVEYRWRWAFWHWGWHWACTFHIFCVDFICFWCPTRTPFPVEYGLNIQELLPGR